MSNNFNFWEDDDFWVGEDWSWTHEMCPACSSVDISTAEPESLYSFVCNNCNYEFD